MENNINIGIQERYFKVPHVLPYLQGLGSYDKLVLLAIMERENQFNKMGQEFFLEQATMAKKIGIGKTKFSECIRKLKELGFVDTNKPKHSSVLHYRLNWEKLIQLNKSHDELP